MVRGAEAAGRPQRWGRKIPIASDVARVGAGENQEDSRDDGNWAGVTSTMMLLYLRATDTVLDCSELTRNAWQGRQKRQKVC